MLACLAVAALSTRSRHQRWVPAFLSVDNLERRPIYCSRNSGLSGRVARGSVSPRKMACRSRCWNAFGGSRPSTRARGAA
jgi:hypothetical protein